MERIPEIIDKSWHPYLQPLFDDPKMLKIRDEILASTPFYPDPERYIQSILYAHN
jgi:hypothetical protein